MDPSHDTVATSISSTTNTQVRSSQSFSADPESSLDPSGPDEVSADPPTGVSPLC